MGAFTARLLDTFLASPMVDAFLRAAEWFHMLEACQAKVLALDCRGRGMMPVVLAPEDLVELFGGASGNISLPRGFLDPSGPSVLWKAFQVSMATALTEMAL